MASNKKNANKEPVARYVDFELTDADVESLRRENTERTARLVTARQQQGDLKKEKKFVVEFVAELTDWTLHFLDQGDDVEQAHEHACAVVRGVYLRDEQATGPVAGDVAPFFVAHPLEAVPSAPLPAFCWGDVVPLPPATARAT